MERSPLSLTTDPRLDAALAGGWESWERAAREAGPERVLRWAARRAGPDLPRDDLRDFLAALLAADDPDEAAFARAELAELLEDGLDRADPELIFEATSHLAAIAEDHGDPLAAAEYFLDFLNWRRSEVGVSEPEAVQTALEEIARLAEADGEPKIAAQFAYRLVQFTRKADAEDDAATTGNWEATGEPYASWG